MKMTFHKLNTAKCELKDHLFHRIEYLNIEIAELIKTITVKESENYGRELGIYLNNLVNKGEKCDEHYVNELSKKAKLATLVGQVNSYQKTIEKKLTKVTTRYVISDYDLISPAGFHSTDKVYVTNDVMIQTNKLPANISNNLRVYEIKQG